MFDVVIIGAGVIGLSIARAIDRTRDCMELHWNNQKTLVWDESSNL